MAGGSQQFQGKEVIVFNKMDGMSTQSERYDLPETKAAWMENLQPISPNNLVCTPAAAAAIASVAGVGETITKMFYFDFGQSTDYIICFCASGAAYKVANPTGTITKFANAGTFSSTPDVTQWGTQRLLIADSIAGYCTYDGTVFVEAGGVSPNIEVTAGGSGYTGGASVTISGGSGSGATATATLVGNIVTSIVLTNGGTGYLPSDILTLSIGATGGTDATGTVTFVSNPLNGTNIVLNGVTWTFVSSGATGNQTNIKGTLALTLTQLVADLNASTNASIIQATYSATTTVLTVTFAVAGTVGNAYTLAVGTVSGVSVSGATLSGGTGAGSGATAIGHVWPTLTPKPTTIAVYQGRVWLAQDNVLTYSGTGATYGGIGYDDFISGDASGSTTIQDTDLIHRITALRALNNYLFIFGDSSIKQIGNISVSGSATLFTITTLSSDQGTTFPDTIRSYNRLVIFANETAVFAVFGSSVEKISDDMDGIFRLTNFSQLPVAAVCDINNIHVYLILVQYLDPEEGTRSLILAFMNKKWFVISQSNSLSYILTGIINSVYYLYGTSGADITPLLANANAPVSIKLQTSLTSHGAPFEAKRTVRYAIAQTVAATATMQLLIESERTAPLPQQIDYNISSQINFINNSGGALQFVNSGGGNLNFITNNASFHYQRGNTNGQGGVYIGMTLTGMVQEFTLNSMMIEVGSGAAFGSEAVDYAATL